MGLTLKSAINIPGNVAGFRDDIPNGAVGDAGDFAYGLNPRRRHGITVLKPDGAEVFLSNTVVDKNSARITNIDDPDIVWVSRSTGIDPFFVGDEKGLTFMKVISDNDPTTAAAEIAISEL